MMASSTLLLIKTFLKSTDNINILKYSKDKAKRRYAISSLVGQAILHVVFMLYVTLLSVGLAKYGLAEDIPAICALILLAMSFVFTLFKSNGYLFDFKEYDMIMSMPFSVKSIVSGKFWYMYINSISTSVVISLAMLIGYAYGGCLTVWSFLLWVVMTVALPIIPMVFAAALGAIIVKLGAGFKYKNIVQALLTAVILLPVFFGRFFLEKTVSNEELGDMLQSISERVRETVVYIPFAKWFSEAVNRGDLVSFLLVIVSAIVIYELFFVLLGKYYRRMNSRLSAGATGKKYEMTTQKQMSMVNAVAFKEFKRMTGSSVYLLNAGLGYIMVAIMGVALLFVKPEVIINSMMQGNPMSIEADRIFPIIPMIFYFFLGMLPTTACSPSLEGKNYWIMQTLPISPMDDNKGKLLFNLYLSIPVAVFATITASICFRVSVIDALTGVVAISSLCIFSAVSGLRSGLKHRRLDWENEIEVIKQGMAVSMYILPHIVTGFILVPLVLGANYLLHNIPVIMLFITVIAWILTGFAWKGVKKYTK